MHLLAGQQRPSVYTDSDRLSVRIVEASEDYFSYRPFEANEEVSIFHLAHVKVGSAIYSIQQSRIIIPIRPRRAGIGEDDRPQFVYDERP